jgi:hypothetical protein
MLPFEQLGKTLIALFASASSALLSGICFYLLRQSSLAYQYQWGSESHENRVLSAVQFGLVCGAALYFLVFRKIHRKKFL